MVNALHFLRPSCPSAIAEKRTTQKSQGGRSARMKNSGVHPKKTKQGDAACVRSCGSRHRACTTAKKTPPPWEPGRFQARPSRGSNPSFDRRQFLGKKKHVLGGPEDYREPPCARGALLTRIAPSSGSEVSEKASEKARRLLRRLLRRQEGSELSEASQKAGGLPREGGGF